MSTHNIVYAIHNFEAENEDEINFLVDEPITVLEKDEKYLDGWWQGKNLRGETGLFPMNYTSPEKPTSLVDNHITATTAEQSPQPPLEILQTPQISAIQKQEEQQNFMPSPYLSSRSSGSTIEEEIDNALFQLQIASPPSTKQQQQRETTEMTSTTPSAAAVSLMNHHNHMNSTHKVENWDVEQVADWLNSVGLDSVSANFIDQEITGDILLDLNIEALKELGIATFGKRYKVMQAITLLKEESLVSTMTEKPTPNTSVSTSAISRPTSRKSIPSSLRRSNSQTNSIAGSTSEQSDALYQFPRKAPLPPGFNNDNNESIYSHLSPPARPLQQGSDVIRPISPTSLTSSGVSRSNTFNTVSSGGSGTPRSREKSPDPKGFQSPRRVLSQKSARTFDSLDKDLSTSNNININNHQQTAQQPKNDWMMMNESNNIVPTTSHSASIIHPLNTPTSSTSTPRQPMQISNTHKLSVSSFDEQSVNNRSSTTEAFQAPEHEGWLHKQSDKYKTWNKRWFVLKGSNLFYFKSPKDVRMKGIINLRGYKIIVDETIHAGKYCFKAQHDRERTFFFYTDTEESMRIWLKMLMKTTIARDFRAPVMSSNHIATVSLDVARRMRPRPPSVIMYKNQKQLKMNSAPNDPKMMSMLEEEEEQHNNYIPIQQHNHHQAEEQQQTQPPQQQQHNTPPLSQYRPTRESGITVHPAANEEEQEVIPEVPSRYPSSHLLQQQQDNNTMMMINDEEEEDLIDPQHRSLPLDSALSVTSSLSNNSAASADEWGVRQYIDWINSYLPAGKKAIDLTSAFRNGDTLITLLEAISGKEVRRPPVQKGGSMSVMMLDNIVAAFKFMGREGVEVDGRYTIKDVFGGNEMKIITMLDAIKAWADMNYPVSASLSSDILPATVAPNKKSDTSVLIGKNSGWRGSAMMDQRHTHSISDEGY